MKTSSHDLYLYDDVRPLLYFTENSCMKTDNAPMNKLPIKVHKGMDNKINFRVFDPDRKPYNIRGFGDIYMRVTDIQNNTIVMERKARSGNSTGMIHFDVFESDLTDIPNGKYSMVVYAQDQFVKGGIGVGEYTSSPFYSDFNGNIKLTLEITDQGQRDPIPSIEILEEDWTPFRHFRNDQSLPVSAFYSQAINGARVRNNINNVHTFSVQGDNFTGSLEVYGTLEAQPAASVDDPSWFRIFLSPTQNVILMSEFTGIDAFTFSSNVMWLKFVYTPSVEVEDPGVLKKLLVRP
jgi:hypothetical protein